MSTCASGGASRCEENRSWSEVSPMGEVFEPFAVMLYRRHREGATIEQLAARFGIPEERVKARLEAAAALEERERCRAGLLALQRELLTS